MKEIQLQEDGRIKVITPREPNVEFLTPERIGYLIAELDTQITKLHAKKDEYEDLLDKKDTLEVGVVDVL